MDSVGRVSDRDRDRNVHRGSNRSWRGLQPRAVSPSIRDGDVLLDTRGDVRVGIG